MRKEAISLAPFPFVNPDLQASYSSEKILIFENAIIPK
jgi:hypothetical protein